MTVKCRLQKKSRDQGQKINGLWKQLRNMKGNYTSASLITLAFDKVNHRTLWRGMRHISIPEHQITGTLIEKHFRNLEVTIRTVSLISIQKSSYVTF